MSRLNPHTKQLLIDAVRAHPGFGEALLKEVYGKAGRNYLEEKYQASGKIRLLKPLPPPRGKLVKNFCNITVPKEVYYKIINAARTADLARNVYIRTLIAEHMKEEGFAAPDETRITKFAELKETGIYALHFTFNQDWVRGVTSFCEHLDVSLLKLVSDTVYNKFAPHLRPEIVESEEVKPVTSALVSLPPRLLLRLDNRARERDLARMVIIRELLVERLVCEGFPRLRFPRSSYQPFRGKAGSRVRVAVTFNDAWVDVMMRVVAKLEMTHSEFIREVIEEEFGL